MGSKCGTGIDMPLSENGLLHVTLARLRSPTSGMEVNGAISGAEEWWTGQVQWSSIKHHTADVWSVGGSMLNLVISVQKQFKPANILVVYPALLLPDW